MELHVASDLIIALCYFSIPLLLIYFRRKCPNIPFQGVLWLFCGFSIAGATTHLMAVWTFWHPYYWLYGLWKAITAGVFLYIICKLVYVIPEVISQLQREIDEHRQVEVALREREQQYRTVVDNVKEVIFQTDANGLWVFLNSAWSEITGFAIAQSLGTLFLDYVHPDDRQHNLKAFQPLIEGKKEYYRHEVRYLTASGGYRWIEVFAQLTFDADGTISGTCGTLYDITERKQAEAEILNALAQAKELGDLRSRFISITSHEFRTSLTTIMSTAELLEYYEWTKQEELQQLHLIQDAVKQMLQLLSDLLFIGTAEAGQLGFNPEPLDLKEFCQDLVAEIQQSLKLASTDLQHTLMFASPDQTLLACMDKKLLRQLLSNLLLNAIKYSPTIGTVQFKLACQGDEAIFEIQDQGIGIPKDDQPRLFEFFYRGKNVGAIAGSGLGLAIVKQCIDLHSGYITFNSEVGVGTVFTVILPLKNHFCLAPYT